MLAPTPRPMKGQDRLDHDRDRHFQADQRDQQRRRRRQHLADDGLPVGEAEQSRRGDIIVPGHDQHFAPQHAAKASPIDQHDGEDDFAQADAEPDHQDQRQDHRRKRHPDINQAADQPINDAAEIARDMRQHGADDHGAKRREQRHQHRRARAKNQARQHAAAEAVGAQWISHVAAVGPGRGLQDRQQILIARIVWRDPAGEYRAKNDANNHAERDQNPGRMQRTMHGARHQRTRSFGLSTT